MEREYFKELSRRLREEGTETSLADKQKLEVLLHGQPVLYVSTTGDVFLLPAGSKSEEASELYHRVAAVADEVYEYVKVLQGAPLLHVSSATATTTKEIIRQPNRISLSGPA